MPFRVARFNQFEVGVGQTGCKEPLAKLFKLPGRPHLADAEDVRVDGLDGFHDRIDRFRALAGLDPPRLQEGCEVFDVVADKDKVASGSRVTAPEDRDQPEDMERGAEQAGQKHREIFSSEACATCTGAAGAAGISIRCS